MVKKIFFLITLSCLNYIHAVDKTFEQVKKEYTGRTIEDVTITDKAETSFFNKDNQNPEGKTLKNVTFKDEVTGDWESVTLDTVTFNQKVNGKWKGVTFKGIIKFDIHPEGVTDDKIKIEKGTNVIDKDAKTLKINATSKKFAY